VTLILRRLPLTTSLFVASITDEFILELDVMHAHDASVDLRRHMMWLSDEAVPFRRLGVIKSPSGAARRTSGGSG
jgi:hypothetical protein